MLISKKAELETERGLEISKIGTRHLLALHRGKLWEGLARLLLFPYGKNQHNNNSNKTTTENKQTRSATLSRDAAAGSLLPTRGPERPPRPGRQVLRRAPAGRSGRYSRRSGPCLPPHQRELTPPDCLSSASPPRQTQAAGSPGAQPARAGCPRSGPGVRRGPRAGRPSHPAFGPKPPRRHTTRRSRPRQWPGLPRPRSCHRSLTAASPRAGPSRAGPPLTWVRAATAPTPPGRACATPYHGARASLIT